MSGTGTNPLIAQGTLNRVRVHIVVPSYPTLNITPENMSKAFASINFEGAFTDQIETATGVVTSPEPYVMGTVTCGVLRTQSLGAAWLAQAQNTTVLGLITIHSDSAAWPSISLLQTKYTLDPGAYDGKEGIVRISFRGVYTINNSLWFGI